MEQHFPGGGHSESLHTKPASLCSGKSMQTGRCRRLFRHVFTYHHRQEGVPSLHGCIPFRSQLDGLPGKFRFKRSGLISAQNEVFARFFPANPCGRAGEASPILEGAARHDFTIGFQHRVSGLLGTFFAAPNGGKRQFRGSALQVGYLG